jgi:excisionase family DNA binding protein
MLDVTAVCERLRCSRATVYRLIHSGQLQAHKGQGRNSHLRIKPESVEEYLAASVVPGPSATDEPDEPSAA